MLISTQKNPVSPMRIIVILSKFNAYIKFSLLSSSSYGDVLDQIVMMMVMMIGDEWDGDGKTTRRQRHDTDLPFSQMANADRYAQI